MIGFWLALVLFFIFVVLFFYGLFRRVVREVFDEDSPFKRPSEIVDFNWHESHPSFTGFKETIHVSNSDFEDAVYVDENY